MIRVPLPLNLTLLKSLIFLLLCGISFYFGLYLKSIVNDKVKYLKPKPEPYSLPLIDFTKEKTKSVSQDINKLGWLEKSALLIDTPGCQIPRTSIFPKFYKKPWPKVLVNVPDCHSEKLLSTLVPEKLVIKPNPVMAKLNCCLHEITRKTNTDHGYNISKCKKFDHHPISVTQSEILLTKCGTSHFNFDAQILISNKPNVKRKLEYWKHIPIQDHPPSVIFLGIDSVSRSHAFRSLIKTTRLMKQMGFKDFQGYHSMAAGTFHNFVGFLMGLLGRKSEAMKSCAPKWSSSYDTCPFIWKEFSKMNYITMYIEDGPQTFNWGGQGGFKNGPPTDYYIHSMFSAIRHLPHNIGCVSNETLPQFLVRYTKNFIQKFVKEKSPMFSFTWFSDPFHDNQYALKSMDDHFVKFFQNLQTLPKFLDQAVIILNSDHGDRFTNYNTQSLESYLEKSLPPLFIRFPKSLERNFPDLDNVVEANTKVLISPLDLHHTFKHILSLKSKTSNFQPVKNDRSSLLVRINGNRTCAQLKINPEACVCGAAIENKPIRNRFYLNKILNFALKKLNQFVEESKYKKYCWAWTASVKDVMYSRVLKKTQNYTDNLIQFETKQGKAKFEAKIQVIHSSTSFDGCKLIGDLSRIDSYGNQSHCVKLETGSDKKFKEFCICK